MSTKTKKPSAIDQVNKLAAQAGMVLMATAATVGMLELPDKPNSRVTAPSQPAFAFADESLNSEANNPLRREREETAPHYISYSVAQRTPARSGRR